MFNFYCNFNTEITCLACSRYRNVRSKLFQTAPETTGTQLSFHKKRVRYKLTFSEKQINCMLKLQLTDRVYNNRIAAAQSPCLHHSSFRYFPKSNFALFALFFFRAIKPPCITACIINLMTLLSRTLYQKSDIACLE